MSRIGRRPIPLPKGVTVKIEATVAVQGPKEIYTRTCPSVLPSSSRTGIWSCVCDKAHAKLNEVDEQVGPPGPGNAVVVAPAAVVPAAVAPRAGCSSKKIVSTYYSEPSILDFQQFGTDGDNDVRGSTIGTCCSRASSSRASTRPTA